MSQIPKASIYTKKGDRGTTKLVDGKTVPKHDPRVSAYGDVDELNSVIGLLKISLQKTFSQSLDNSSQTSLEVSLFRVQNHLFNIGSLLACEDTKILEKLPRMDETHVKWLESEIDLYNHELPPLKEFILPGGHEAAAWAHLARTVCRRAERHVSQLALSEEPYSSCLIYLNRLSDYFFILARYVHQKTQTPEIRWDSKV